MSIDIRILESKGKIAVLWILFGINMTIVFTLKDFDPGRTGLGQTLSTLPSQQLYMILAGDAVIRLIPFVLAFLSLTLKSVWNRRINLILGFVFAIFAIFGLVSLLLQITDAIVYELVIQLVAIIVPILIFWYAYWWPKEEIM